MWSGKRRRLGVMLILCGPGALSACAARADRAGEALLDRCIAAETRTASLSANFRSEIVRGRQTVTIKGSFALKKPNLAHIVYSGIGGPNDEVLNSDGRRLLHLMESEKQYTRDTPDLSGGNVVRDAQSLEAMVFFNSDLLNQFRDLGTGLRIVGAVTVGRVRCQALQASVRNGSIFKIYIGPDGLLRGITQMTGKGEARQVLESRLTGVRTGAPVSFAWSPPAKAKLVDQIRLQASSGGNGLSPGAELLKPGTTAPAFSLPTPAGRRETLAALLAPGHVTLVNFWGYG